MNNIIKLLFTFFINPFVSFWVSMVELMKRPSASERNIIYVIISLVFGLIAFTQETSTGDLVRVYDSIIIGDRAFRAAPWPWLLETKHLLFDGVNQIVYILTGDVRYISLLWISILFYITFKSIDMFLRYKKIDVDSVKFSSIIISTVFCFIIFTQVTELMKQSTSTAFIFFAYSLYLNKDYKKAFLWFIMALNIHFSCLFYLPLLFATYLKKWIPYLIVFVSFAFKQFNLMDFVINILNRIPGINNLRFIEQVYSAAEQYGVEYDGFFQSGSFMFLAIFYHFFFITLVFKLTNPQSKLLNVCMIMVAILNLCYINNHNYTRMLTMMFPLYIIIFIELLGRRESLNKILMYVLVLGCFIVNMRFFTMRIMDSAYSTSFLDNSIFKLVFYPSFMYLID